MHVCYGHNTTPKHQQNEQLFLTMHCTLCTSSFYSISDVTSLPEFKMGHCLNTVSHLHQFIAKVLAPGLTLFHACQGEP